MKTIALFLALTMAAAVPAAATPAAPAAPAAPVHPYRAALAALDNFASCRGAGGPVLDALRARMTTLEAAAARKGLRPALERVNQAYMNMLAVSTMVRCVNGLSRSRSAARQGVAGFADWVEAQPGR